MSFEITRKPKSKSKIIVSNLLFAFLGLFILTSCNEDKKYTPQDLDKPSEIEKAYSYVLGIEFGDANSKVDTLKIDYDYFIAGFEDAANKKDRMFTWAEIDSIKRAYTDIQLQRSVQMEEQKKKDFDSLSNFYIDNNPIFFAENAKKEGVIEMEANGLQYKYLKKGNSKISPKPDQEVVMHFVAKLIDGTEFDNSYKKQYPMKQILERMNPAWQSVISKMVIGDKIRVWLAPKYGFGATGMSNLVPPNAILELEFDLLEVNDGGMLQGREEMPPQGGPGPR